MLTSSPMENNALCDPAVLLFSIDVNRTCRIFAFSFSRTREIILKIFDEIVEWYNDRFGWTSVSETHARCVECRIMHFVSALSKSLQKPTFQKSRRPCAIFRLCGRSK